MAFARVSAAFVVLSVLSAMHPAVAWAPGRATFYGRDGYSIHTGACGYGFLCPNRWAGELQSGRYITAISDTMPLYKNGNHGCGTCIAIKCRSADFTDYYGNSYDREDTSTQHICNDYTVKVMVTDVCPCNYPGNEVSNKRWCCGDMTHFDMSEWAFAAIIQDHSRWGVAAVSWQIVGCDQDISNENPTVTQLSDPWASLKPASLSCSSSGSTTEGKSPVKRASAPKPKPTPKKSPKKSPTPKRRPTPKRSPTPKPKSWGVAAKYSKKVAPGNKHSAFYWARRRAYQEAAKYPNHSKGFWTQLAKIWYNT